jgi:hypothetical protein
LSHTTGFPNKRENDTLRINFSGALSFSIRVKAIRCSDKKGKYRSKKVLKNARFSHRQQFGLLQDS